MKERPIIFNLKMVSAVLDGRKTQTRRPIKADAPIQVTESGRPLFYDKYGRRTKPRCPFGQVGDRLWVREAFAVVPRTAYAQSDGVQQLMRPDDDHDAAVFRAGWERSAPKWKPSIHMPRWASRVLLEITGIRVQQVQSISEADAIAEGVEKIGNRYKGYMPLNTGKEYSPATAKTSFSQLWETIYGESWSRNDWVWVVEFKRIEPEQ